MSSIRRSELASKDQLRLLYGFMAPRHFVAGREELTSAGFSASRVDNWIRNGRLIGVLRSVYSYGRDIETRPAALRAALLAAGEGSVLTGQSSCELWGMIKARPGLPFRIHVGSPNGQARILRGLSPALRDTRVKVIVREFERDDISERDALVMTNPILALTEYALDAPSNGIRFAFLEGCRLNLVNGQTIEDYYPKIEGRRGAKKLRPYLTLWVPELLRIRSVLEGWFILVWVNRGLPMPQVNEKVFGREVDLYWPALNLVLELDGDSFHGDPAQKRIDAEKQRYLESRGLTVRRLTFRQFASDPEAVVSQFASQHGFTGSVNRRQVIV